MTRLRNWLLAGAVIPLIFLLVGAVMNVPASGLLLGVQLVLGLFLVPAQLVLWPASSVFIVMDTWSKPPGFLYWAGVLTLSIVSNVVLYGAVGLLIQNARRVLRRRFD